MSGRRSVIVGTGSFLPPDVVPSAVIERRHGLPDGYCRKRTGIAERRAASRGMTSWQMGAEAARLALESAQVGPGELDHVLFHTSYSETHYPTPGVFLAGALGLEGHVPILEVKAACTAFLSMLHLADGLLRSGLSRRVLLVCSERVYDDAQHYEASAPLFGDGAAAAVVEGVPAERVGDGGLLWSRNWTDGSGGNLCMATTTSFDLTRKELYPAPPELEPAVAVWADRELDPKHILSHWDGAAIFRSAVRYMGSALERALAATGLDREQVDHFLIHQANAKILSSLVRQFRIPKDRVPSNIARYGNTSSATVPILLDEGIRDGRIGAGHTLVLVAFGAGFTYGSAVYRVPDAEVRA